VPLEKNAVILEQIYYIYGKIRKASCPVSATEKDGLVALPWQGRHDRVIVCIGTKY
jgi:hypothetical protein